MDMPSDPNANTRARIILFSLLFVIACSVGAYFIGDLGKLQDSIAARESQAALQGITEPAQLDEALRQNPSNKFLQMMAMATRAADETNAATEKLSNELEPPAISKNSNLGGASRSDLDALRRDLKTAEANATTFLPRYTALLKAERDSVEKYARSLGVGPDTTSKLLDNIDKRHAEIGTYKVVNGQLIFPLQRTVDRYNVAANAVTVAAKRVAELGEERKTMLKSQRERWAQFVKGMRS